MPTYGGFEEGKRIMTEYEITPQFISGLLDGKPSFSAIYKWTSGTPLGDEQRVLDLLRRLKAKADAVSPVPVSFKNCTILVWRTLLSREDGDTCPADRLRRAGLTGLDNRVLSEAAK